MNAATAALAAAIITLLLGPAMFFAFGRRYRTKPAFPAVAVEAWGFILLLPTFNAFAVQYGILALLFTDARYAVISFVVAYILTRVFVIYRKDFARRDDWSRPKRGTFSAGGWYHAAFMFLQLSFICISLIFLYRRPVLWMIVAGFLLLALADLKRRRSA